VKAYIALFRGINLVGRNALPMAALRKLIEENGCSDVRTYIQSGNALFRTVAEPAHLEERFAVAVSKAHGFRPRVLILTRSQIARAAAANPFPQASENPQSVHLFFLGAKPRTPDLEAIERVKAKSERWALKGKVFYLHTPDGFGQSKLAERVERLLGVEATARNWNTVTKLLELSK
jgi:uncharacterized protein (DUF1697 family)